MARLFLKSLYLLYLVLLLGIEKKSYIPVWEFIVFSGVVMELEVELLVVVDDVVVSF